MKTIFEVIYFEFNQPLHISNARADYGISERIIHSDTLYAAIMQSWAILGKSEWINEKPDFTLSSLFPFTTNKATKVHFFAKPFFQANTEKTQERSEDAKKFKKIKYVDAFHFERYLNKQIISSGTDSVKGSYQTNEAIDKDFLTSDIQPRIKRPRNEQEDSVPFYTERLFFKEGSGMFCFVQYDDELAKKRVKVALELLADNGIGTDRAVGNGRFKLDFGQISLELADNTEFAMNMSLFCPESKIDLQEMLSDSNARYDMIKRGGWISEPHNTYRKRSVYMFREGSLFRIPNKNAFSKGNTINLQPDNSILPQKIENPIWRVGKALFLPVKR